VQLGGPRAGERVEIGIRQETILLALVPDEVHRIRLDLIKKWRSALIKPKFVAAFANTCDGREVSLGDSITSSTRIRFSVHTSAAGI
jgi:hypothetical protein